MDWHLGQRWPCRLGAGSAGGLMGAPVDSVRRRHAARVLHRPLAACACELFPPHTGTDAGAHNELAAGRGRRYAKSLRLSACCGVRSHCWACVEAHERSPPSSSQQGRHHGHTTQAQLCLEVLGAVAAVAAVARITPNSRAEGLPLAGRLLAPHLLLRRRHRRQVPFQPLCSPS